MLYSDEFLDLDQGPDLREALRTLLPITQMYDEVSGRWAGDNRHPELMPNWFDDFQKCLIDAYLSEKEDFSEVVRFLNTTTDLNRIDYEISAEELQFRMEFAANFLMVLKEQGRIKAGQVSMVAQYNEVIFRLVSVLSQDVLAHQEGANHGTI